MLYLQRIFTVDLRALALMRIGTAFLLLLDLFFRAQHLEAHYTDAGVVPLEVLAVMDYHQYFISLHALSGSLVVQILLFGLAAVAALFLLAGVYTGLASALSWFLLLSLQNRNQFILTGADDVLLLLLFWGMFLPWGRKYSWKEKEQTTSHFQGVAAVGYLLLIVSIYFFSALSKDSLEWNQEATALYYSLNLKQLTFPFADFLLNYPSLLKLLTRTVYFLELLGPFLLLVPVRWCRKNGLFLFLLFHLGIALTFSIGLFPWVSIVALMGLFPEDWMNKIDALFTKLFPPLFSGKETKFSLPYWARLREMGLAFVIIFSLYYNVVNLPQNDSEPRGGVKAFAYLFGLDQSWGMFAPQVMKEDGWPILEGTTATGDKIMINQEGAALQLEKPTNVKPFFGGERWRKLFENHYRYGQSFLWDYYCRYQYQHWNETHPDQEIKSLHVIFMKEVNLSEGQRTAAVQDTLSSCAF